MIVVELLPFRQNEFVALLGSRDDYFRVDLTPLEAHIRNGADVDHHVFYAERRVEMRDLELETPIGEFDDTACRYKPAHVVYRFLHENSLFSGNLQSDTFPMISYTRELPEACHI